MKPRELGAVQWLYLQYLADMRDSAGVWYQGCGWGGGPTRDVQIFEGLAKHGFCTREQTAQGKPQFRITEAGRDHRERHRKQLIARTE